MSEKMNQSWMDIRRSYESGFFEDIGQGEAVRSGYDIRFPLFYPGQSAFGAFFAVRYKRLLEAMPRDPRLRPLQLIPGVGLLSILVTRNVETDIGPYNSIIVAIMLKHPEHVGYFSPLNIIPGFETFRQAALSRLMHAFIWSIPDNSYPSIVAGADWFNMPKFMADVDWEEGDDNITVTSREKDQLIMTMRARKIPTLNMTRGGKADLIAYFYMDKLPQPEYCRVQAVDGAGLSFKKDDFVLELGMQHPMGKEISDILLSTRPLAYMYLPKSHLLIYEPGRQAPELPEFKPV